MKADLRIGSLGDGKGGAIDRGSLRLDVGRPDSPNGSASLDAQLELIAMDGSRLTASAASGVRFHDGVVPSIDPQHASRLIAKADHFRLAAVTPWTAGAVSRMDGLLNGELQVGVGRSGDTGGDGVKVAMKLSDVVFNLPAIGQEFHNAGLTLRSGENGTIVLTDISAEGTRGKITGSGQVQFSGLRFVGGKLKLSIAEGAELPLTVEGVPFGDARGEFEMSAKAREGALELRVAVPKLHIDLPKAVGRGVQDLHDNPAITVVDQQSPALVPHEKSGQVVIVNLDLGQVIVKARMLNVELTSVPQAPLRVEVGDTTRITGDIRFTPASKFVVAKKEFDIEHGVIHMREDDPSNPSVILTARWDSPEGPIYIDYNGLLNPITPEKMKFHSPSPTLASQEQIMTMLVTGGADPTASSQGTGQPLSGIGTAAGRVLLDQLSTEIGGGWSTTIQMSDASTVQAGLKYQTDTAAIGVTTYDVQSATTGATGAGVPAGGISAAALTSTDSTARGTHNVITLDWRVFKNWLLRGRIDVGSDTPNSGVDVLWQRRY